MEFSCAYRKRVIVYYSHPQQGRRVVRTIMFSMLDRLGLAAVEHGYRAKTPSPETRGMLDISGGLPLMQGQTHSGTCKHAYLKMDCEICAALPTGDNYEAAIYSNL